MRISDWSSDVCSFRSGKGNDQVRFELGYYALKPDIKVIAPWREWDLTSRTKLIAFAEQHQIPIAKDKRGEAPFSVDANLLHISAEGRSEEHTSELQSLMRISYAVFCLKKKTQAKTTTHQPYVHS